jgi:5'(3')-deoxyribonucleotidase
LKDYALPNINPDRPYKNNIKGWEVDCYIKTHIDAVFTAFNKTVEFLGAKKFTEQVKEEIQTINDIAALSGPEERFSR